MTGGWPDPEDAAHLAEGLGKAGLDTPIDPAAADREQHSVNPLLIGERRAVFPPKPARAPRKYAHFLGTLASGPGRKIVTAVTDKGDSPRR